MKMNEKIIIKNKNEEEETVLEIGEYKKGGGCDVLH